MSISVIGLSIRAHDTPNAAYQRYLLHCAGQNQSCDARLARRRYSIRARMLPIPIATFRLIVK